MGWIQLAVLAIQLTIKIWDAIKETQNELKKKKTEEIQSGIRGIIDGDASRITASLSNLKRMR